MSACVYSRPGAGSHKPSKCTSSCVTTIEVTGSSSKGELGRAGFYWRWWWVKSGCLIQYLSILFEILRSITVFFGKLNLAGHLLCKSEFISCTDACDSVVNVNLLSCKSMTTKHTFWSINLQGLWCFLVRLCCCCEGGTFWKKCRAWQMNISEFQFNSISLAEGFGNWELC